MSTTLTAAEVVVYEQEPLTLTFEEDLYGRLSAESTPMSRAAELALKDLRREYEYSEIDGLWVTEGELVLTEMSLLLNARKKGNADDQEYVVKISGIGDEPTTEPDVPNELTTLFKLPEHPHIPKVVSTGMLQKGQGEAAYWYGVTEKAQHGTLEGLLPIRSPEELHRALGLLSGATEALVFAHETGVVHLDVKPRNIFDTGQGGLLGDWANAAPVGSKRPLKVVMSRGYSAPENVFDVERYSAASDAYGLGKTLLDIIGQQPSLNEVSNESAEPKPDLVETLVDYGKRSIDSDSRKRPQPIELLEILHTHDQAA